MSPLAATRDGALMTRVPPSTSGFHGPGCGFLLPTGWLRDRSGLGSRQACREAGQAARRRQRRLRMRCHRRIPAEASDREGKVRSVGDHCGACPADLAGGHIQAARW